MSDGKGFKLIDDLTSDVMFEAEGKTLEELFEHAAGAMFSVICQVSEIERLEEREIELEAKDTEKLLKAWLQELIARVDADEMFFCGFDIVYVKESSGIWQLRARVYGEPITPEKGGTVVKAVTNYGFKLEKTENGYKARVALDI